MKINSNCPLVSIIIPIYNASRYLNDALNCIKNQTYKNIEVICVDDGSTDNSINIIETFTKNDSRFRLFKQQNLHAGIARNAGLQNAKGEYVIFLDADDLFSKKLISTLIKAAKQDNSDMVVCNYYSFSNNKMLKQKHTQKYAGTNKAPLDIKDDVFQMTIGAPWNKFYRMDFIRRTGILFQGTLNSNDIFFTRMTTVLAEKISFIDNRLISYRVFNKNSLQGDVNKSSTSFSVACSAIIDELKNKDLFITYKNSIQQYAIELCFTALEKARDSSTIEDVFKASNMLLNKAEIEISNKEPTILRDRCINHILLSNFSGFLEDYFFLTKQNMVSMATIEYRIGKKIMRFLKIKQ